MKEYNSGTEFKKFDVPPKSCVTNYWAFLAAHCIVGKHPFFETSYLNPAVPSVCREYLGEDMVLYDAKARSIRPSEGKEPGRGFQVHADRSPFSIVPFEGGKHYPMAINVAWAVVDFSAENGATLAWPGTHNSCQIRDPNADYLGFRQATVPAGTAIVWDAATWHASGINRSDHDRHSILAISHRWWVEGMIENARVMPQSVQDRLLPEMRKLLGLEETIPEYTEVRALSPEQIKRLTPWEKDGWGLGLTEGPRHTSVCLVDFIRPSDIKYRVQA